MLVTLRISRSAASWPSDVVRSSFRVSSWRMAFFQSSWRRMPCAAIASNLSAAAFVSNSILDFFSAASFSWRSFSAAAAASALALRSALSFSSRSRLVVCWTTLPPFDFMNDIHFFTFSTSWDTFTCSSWSTTTRESSASLSMTSLVCSVSCASSAPFATILRTACRMRTALALQAYAFSHSSFMVTTVCDGCAAGAGSFAAAGGAFVEAADVLALAGAAFVEAASALAGAAFVEAELTLASAGAAFVSAVAAGAGAAAAATSFVEAMASRSSFDGPGFSKSPSSLGSTLRSSEVGFSTSAIAFAAKASNSSANFSAAATVLRIAVRALSMFPVIIARCSASCALRLDT